MLVFLFFDFKIIFIFFLMWIQKLFLRVFGSENFNFEIILGLVWDTNFKKIFLIKEILSDIFFISNNIILGLGY